MRLSPLSRIALGCLGLVLVAGVVHAAAPPDPLRLVPPQADLFVEVKQPSKLAETLTTLKLLRELKGLQQVQELFDSTNARRFNQLVAYFERELGAKWPELLQRLAGGGAVYAGQLYGEQKLALFVVQGEDEQLMRKFARLALEVVEQELARQESKEKVEKGAYRQIEVVHVGKNIHAALAGSALLISGTDKGLQQALDLYLDRDRKGLAANPLVPEAEKLLPSQPVALAWVKLDPIHKGEQAKELFAVPRTNSILTVLFGGYLDVAGRAPFACAGLYPQKDGFVATVRLPRGREGMPPWLSVHVPPAGQPGSRPLLQPQRAILSTSYYLDVSKFWEDRHKLFNGQAVEDFDKISGPYFAGTQFSKLLREAGAYQRVVVAAQEKTGYKVRSRTELPAFAFIVEERDPEFSRSMEAILRAAALLGTGTEGRLKLTEEKHGDVALVGYRFSEKVKIPNDVNDIRFNFSPCFFTVGKQFVVSSTLELGHELVDLLEKEEHSGSLQGDRATVRTQVYSEGGARLLSASEDILITQAILDQALAPEAARQQVRAFVEMMRRLGVLELEAGYGEHDFHYDIHMTLGE